MPLLCAFAARHGLWAGALLALGRVERITTSTGRLGLSQRIAADTHSGACGPAYSASKAGVVNLVMVAQQLRETKVRVIVICPGPTETGMTKPTFDCAEAKGVTYMLGRSNPLRCAAQPEALAQGALFLASQQSSYVKGQAIVVERGLSSSRPVARQLPGQAAV
jgi:NAD(P)-dependent dehydrogenase (short-subunit alcohol dehydrogenase family)